MLRGIIPLRRERRIGPHAGLYVLSHLYGEARARQSRITLAPVEEMPEREAADPGFDRFPLDRSAFDDDERHLLATFARSLNLAQAATELGITPKALRSRLERLKARQRMNLFANMIVP